MSLIVNYMKKSNVSSHLDAFFQQFLFLPSSSLAFVPSETNLGQDIAGFFTQTGERITLPSITVARITHQPLCLFVIH